VSRTVILAAGDLARIFGDKAEKVEVKVVPATMTGKARTVRAKQRPAQRKRPARAQARPEPKQKPQPRSRGVVKRGPRQQPGRQREGKSLTVQPYKRIAEAFMIPGRFGDVRLPLGSAPVPTAVSKVTDVYPWSSVQPAQIATNAGFISPQEGFAVLSRDPLCALRFVTHGSLLADLNTISYLANIVTQNPEVLEGAATAQPAMYLPLGEYGAGTNTTFEVNLAYWLAENTQKPFGAFTPAFVDRLQAGAKTYFYAQPGLMASTTFALSSDWMTPVVALNFQYFRWDNGAEIGISAQPLVVTTLTPFTSTFSFTQPGYYRLALQVQVSSFGTAGTSASMSLSLLGDDSVFPPGTLSCDFLEHHCSPSIANAITSQFTDIKATGSQITATQIGQNLQRNGAVYLRQFESDVNWLSFIGISAELSVTGDLGVTRMTEYPDFKQMDMVNGWAAWVKPDDQQTHGFHNALSVDRSNNLLQARSSLRDLGWVGVAWTTDPTVVTNLQFAVATGFEYTTSDKTRDTAECPYTAAQADAAEEFLWRIGPEVQFTENPDHIATALTKLFGGGLKAAGGAIGGRFGGWLSKAGGAATQAAPFVDQVANLAQMLGNLI